MRSATAPVKAPLLVAEQLALDEALGEGGAVDAHERAGGARAFVVHELGHPLLARPALALHEHGERGVGNGHGEVQHLAQRRVVGEDGAVAAPLPREPGAQRHHLCPQPVVAEGAREEGPQRGQVDGLDEVVVGPLAHRLDGALDRAVGGDEHDGGLGHAAVQVFEDREAVDGAHHQVHEREVVAARRRGVECVVGAGEGVHLGAEGLQRERERLEHVRLVVEHEHAGG